MARMNLLKRQWEKNETETKNLNLNANFCNKRAQGYFFRL